MVPASKGKKELKVKVDRVFYRRLGKILRICFPKKSKEVFYLIALSVLLLSRTWLSVVIARIAGNNGQNLVSRNWKPFFRGVFAFMMVTLPAAGVNSGLKYFTSVLSLGIRVRLSKYVHHEYLRGVNFYKAINLGGQGSLDNPDQRVTADISNFSDALSNLYAETFKPVLDVLLFTFQLTKILGWQGPTFMYMYFIVSAFIKRKLMPSFGKYVAQESELEGHYRTAHNRIISNAEEIAFYDGAAKEKTIIEASLTRIFRHIVTERKLRALVGVFDGLIVKYWASIAGYIVVASPYLLNLEHVKGKNTAEITHDYILNAQYLTGLSQAVGQLVLVGNKLTSIAGYTHRVSELLEMVSHLNDAGNVPFEVVEDEKEAYEAKQGIKEWLDNWRDRCIVQHDLRQQIRHDKERDVNQIQGGGIVHNGADFIKFEDCDLVAPDGQLLARHLSFQVNPGVNVMVTGPNGCGKSSLFRIIGELWPLHSGTMYKPFREDILFVPQKPYLVLGSLRDQIIYPHSLEQMQTLGVTDDDLCHLLEAVDPRLTILGTWSWDDNKDWTTALSGGQKQRIAMARVFYHRPKYAILDECTSCVSDEVEDAVYEICKQLGVTIFTVSHRPALRRHHDFILNFDGRGSWEWEPCK